MGYYGHTGYHGYILGLNLYCLCLHFIHKTANIISLAILYKYSKQFLLQWSPSKTDTIGEVKIVLYSGVFKVILIHFETNTNVLYVEGVLNLGVFF